MGKSTISMAIFNGYVNLPEGTDSPQQKLDSFWSRNEWSTSRGFEGFLQQIFFVYAKINSSINK